MIKIQDVASITYADSSFAPSNRLTDTPSFQAFLLYLYTGSIDFAPFGSEANRKTRASEIVSLTPDRVPRPSPKSIYRLADKVLSLTFHCTAFPLHHGWTVRFSDTQVCRLQKDQRRARTMRCRPRDLQQIYLPVCPSSARYSCRIISKQPRSYPEILKMHVENLASVLTRIDSEGVQDQLNERLKAFAEGEIDYASEAFSSLWRILTHGDRGGGDGRDETTEVYRDIARFSFFLRRMILMSA